MYGPQRDLSRLGIIAVVFNPVRYRSQYEQYRRFSDHMARSGVNLFTIECIFDSATRFGLLPQRFKVTRPGNPRHFQVVARSVMWLKENLVNIVVQRLPSYIDRIAWIDTDIEFERLDWPYQTLAALERYPIVQMFKTGYFTGPGGIHEVLRGYPSFGYSIRHGRPIQPNHPHWYAHPGYAWAMRRDAFTAIGGLIDFCIIGSGDLHFAYALLGRIQESFPNGVHKDYRMVAKSWGDRVARVARGGFGVGYVNVNLYRHWHGSRDNRSHIGGWSILLYHQFSPTKDLKRDEQTGVLYLSDRRYLGIHSGAARIQEMERAIVNYFVSRNEDNRRVLPRIVAPNYRVPPVPHRHLLRSSHPYGGHYRPAIPIIPPLAAPRPHRYRQSGLYRPFVYY